MDLRVVNGGDGQAGIVGSRHPAEGWEPWTTIE